MECYHCGQENNDGAVFCKQCGQRVDGKTKCPTCNQLIDYDSQFCEYCGSSLQEEQENYSEADETENMIQNDEQTSSDSVRLLKFRPNCKKIFEISGGAFSMMAAFFSLLFTFFIGLNPNGIYPSSLSENVYYSQKSLNIFYYFGECYNDASTISKNYPPFFVSNYYFTAVIGTLLSLAIIVTVVIFAILSVVRYVNYTNGRTAKSYSNFALATSVSFILGSTLFYAFNSLSYNYTTTQLNLALNNYTVAGIVLSSLFIILSYLCKTATLGKTLTTQQNLRKFCFSALGIVLLSFIAVLVATPSISLTMENSATISYNFFGAMSLLAVIYTSQNQTPYAVITSTSQYADPPTDIYTNLVIGLIIQIAIIVMVILMMANLLKYLSDNNKQNSFKGLGIGITTCILSIINMIVTFTAENQIIEYLNTETIEYSCNIYPLVLTVIVSVIYLVIEIIHSVVNINARYNKI